MRIQLAPPFYAGVERDGVPFGAIRVLPYLSRHRRMGLRGVIDTVRNRRYSQGVSYQVVWVVGSDPDHLIDMDDLDDGPYLTAPYGTELSEFDDSQVWLERVFKGTLTSPFLPNETLLVVPFDRKRFDSPDTWFQGEAREFVEALDPVVPECPATFEDPR